MEFALIATGVVAGLVQGIAGAGSAIVLVAVLMLGFQLLPPTAIGAALAVVAVARATGAVLGGRLDVPSRGAALRHGLPGALGAAAGALLTEPILLRGWPYPEEMAFKVVAVALGLTGLHLTLWPQAATGPGAEETLRPASHGAIHPLMAVVFGIGVIAGLSGAGSGLLLAVLLSAGHDGADGETRGTLLLAGTIIAAAGAAVHGVLGHIDPAITSALLLGAVPGTVMGVAWSAAYRVLRRTRQDRRTVEALLEYVGRR